MNEQRVKLLQRGVVKQIEKSTQEFREFSEQGYSALATAAREDVEWLESVNILLFDLIYNSKI
jgi:hypothetical protein